MWTSAATSDACGYPAAVGEFPGLRAATGQSRHLILPVLSCIAIVAASGSVRNAISRPLFAFYGHATSQRPRTGTMATLQRGETPFLRWDCHPSASSCYLDREHRRQRSSTLRPAASSRKFSWNAAESSSSPSPLSRRSPKVCWFFQSRQQRPSRLAAVIVMSLTGAKHGRARSTGSRS